MTTKTTTPGDATADATKQRSEIRDWYQDRDTAAACVIMVIPGADLTTSQVRKVRAACPNWTRDIDEYAQDRDGTVRCRVARAALAGVTT